jgi:peptidase M24-like protein
MQRRRAVLGRELERRGISYALMYGANRSGSAVMWLTGWPVTREALLVMAPRQDDDVLLVSFFNHVPQARRLSATRVEWAGTSAIAAALMPGARAADLAAAASVIEQAGLTAIDDLVHGFGGGYLPPVVPAPGRSLPAPDFTLAAGMTVVVQPNIVTPDGRAGVQTGELLLVTENGPQRVHAYPQGLQQMG